MTFTRLSILFALIFLSLFPSINEINAQNLSIAPIAPRNSELDRSSISELQIELDKHFRVIDPSLSLSAFTAFEGIQPFNLSSEESRNLGEAIGADFLIIIETAVQPRTLVSSRTSFEGFLSIHLIGTRTGALLGWKLFSGTGDTEMTATAIVSKSIPSVVDWLMSVTRDAKRVEGAFDAAKRETLLEDFSARGVTAPAPYRRLSPNYTEQARLYGKEGTIEIEIDLDQKGAIKDTRILRWVGFGLEESVTEAVTKMNWRPAYRNGSPVSSRFVVRYNFKRQ